MATAQSRVTDMTRGDPVRLLLNFSAPLFLSNLLHSSIIWRIPLWPGISWGTLPWRKSGLRLPCMG